MARLLRYPLLTLIFFFPIVVAAQQPTVPEAAVVAADTRFAFKMFRSLALKNKHENLVLAPTGLSLSFALLENGADEKTRTEIESAFEFSGLSLPEINQGFSKLRDDLQLQHAKLTKRPDWMAPEQWQSYRAAPPNGIVVADSIWLRGGLTLPKPFTEIDNANYGVDVKALAPNVSPAIQFSRWAYDRTKNKLMIEPGRIGHNEFVLIDVTHFHSFWEHAFSPSDTKTGIFTLADGSKREAPFMNQRGQFRYLEDPKFHAIVLPYGSESMYIFLPSQDLSLSEFEKELTPESWPEWLSRFESRVGYVALPRIQVASKTDIRPTLREIGVTRIFDTFESLLPIEPVVGAKLTSVSQSTTLKVDERGTEAISIGVFGGVVGGVQGGRLGTPPPPFEMVVDRPFFFAIANERTKQLIFLGAVVCPNC